MKLCTKCRINSGGWRDRPIKMVHAFKMDAVVVAHDCLAFFSSLLCCRAVSQDCFGDANSASFSSWYACVSVHGLSVLVTVDEKKEKKIARSSTHQMKYHSNVARPLVRDQMNKVFLSAVLVCSFWYFEHRPTLLSLSMLSFIFSLKYYLCVCMCACVCV